MRNDDRAFRSLTWSCVRLTQPRAVGGVSAAMQAKETKSQNNARRLGLNAKPGTTRVGAIAE
jgi:hypothetical protein